MCRCGDPSKNTFRRLGAVFGSCEKDGSGSGKFPNGRNCLLPVGWERSLTTNVLVLVHDATYALLSGDLFYGWQSKVFELDLCS